MHAACGLRRLFFSFHQWWSSASTQGLYAAEEALKPRLAGMACICTCADRHQILTASSMPISGILGRTSSWQAFCCARLGIEPQDGLSSLTASGSVPV
eukprot:353965-Pelagomonas_calceolata.AAC.1